LIPRREATQKSRLGTVGSAILAVLLTVGVATSAAAAPSRAETKSKQPRVGPWAVAPYAVGGHARPFFDYLLPPGGTLHDRISIKNFGDIPLTYDLYPADAHNLPTGAFALSGQTAPRVDVGAWVSLPIRTVRVAPHTLTAVPFTLHVPASTTPGDHAGGIVALQRPVAPGRLRGRRVVVRQGVGARIYLRVPGPLHPQVAVTSVKVHRSSGLFGGGHAAIVATVANTGNTRVDGSVVAKATGVFGYSVKTFAPQKFQALLPGNAAQFVFNWPHLPRVGPIHVSVDVNAGKAQAHGGTTFWVIPWLVVLIVILLLGGIGYLRWRRRHRVSPAPPPSEEPDVISAETGQPS
jgi:hypothetical protein